jgi:hypothetical protein
MKNSKILGAIVALAALLGLSAGAARAQNTAPMPTLNPMPTAPSGARTAPIITRVFDKVTFRQPTPEGSEWLKAEVIHADAVTLIVRERANGYAIHTFNFSTELQPKMQAMLDKGGFQYGDKVSILFMPGQTVALRVHGKASKTL